MSIRVCVVFALLAGINLLQADPRISSWYTDHTGLYARIYETDADQVAQNAVTTWSRGAGVQALPTYAGVHEVSYSTDWVYVRSTGLGSHIMGPWYLNPARTNLFPNYPANTSTLYRIPRVPTIPGTKTLTGLGAIGYFADGVAMFDSRDAFSYSDGTGTDQQGGAGDGAWNRDAYVNESVTFDAANAHQAGPNYHYHASPDALRHRLGDSKTYNPAANTYTEVFNGQHSPILGWARDGLPVYGPYGYSDPLNPASAVTRMRSGYQIRAGLVNRTSWPAWATALYAGTGVAFSNGPNVSGAFPLGRYMEDNEYKGDAGMTLGVDFDLNEQNARFCVTPEFPGGTWAYFTCIDATGTPVFPYNIGRGFHGDPTGSAVGSIAEPVTTHFEGGPEKEEAFNSISSDDPGPDDVTMTWSAIEGGTYEVSESTDLGDSDAWDALSPQVTAQSDIAGIIHTGAGGISPETYYKLCRLALATFDDDGFDYNGALPVTFAATFAVPPGFSFQKDIVSITVGGISATIVSFNQITGVIQLNFNPSSLSPGDYNAVLTYNGPGGPTQVLSTNQYNVSSSTPDNILLLIVDDWGIDASPIDNSPGAGIFLPNMPNLQSLAADGLRFTRAFVTPVCSPTRACIMTGRYAHQTGVYVPQDAGAFSTAETTIPDAMTAAGSNYEMASMGKWHLGGNNNGYSARGGWDEFYGINGGGVQDYFNWTKNTNGTAANSTTYTTTDQVNEAVAFINRSQASGLPWFCWVAFNAPHTPFHDPPAALGPYSAQQPGETTDHWRYRKALEALDKELGRLFLAFNPANTNVILIGDNGTPNQVVQPPFGNGHSKGDLYNGGIHVPMVAKGPAVTVPAGSTTDKLVHAVDLYTTILELAGIDPSTVAPPTALAQSNSIVPILNGTDTADRCMVTEGGDPPNRGRAIILDDYPDYKVIIFGDNESTLDTPVYEFYNITLDPNEQNNLLLSPVPLPQHEQDAYLACLAKDAALGGGYSDPPSGGDTLYIELLDPAGPPNVPQLVNGQGNPIHPSSIVVDGVTATYVARVNSGASLADESDDVADRYWVKCIVPINPPYSDATVTFTVQGTDRVFNEIDPILVKP